MLGHMSTIKSGQSIMPAMPAKGQCTHFNQTKTILMPTAALFLYLLFRLTAGNNRKEQKTQKMNLFSRTGVTLTMNSSNYFYKRSYEAKKAI